MANIIRDIKKVKMVHKPPCVSICWYNKIMKTVIVMLSEIDTKCTYCRQL